MTLQEIIMAIAVFGMVPLILGGIILFARSIVYRTAEGEHRISVRAGHYAGFVAFAAFIVSQKTLALRDFGDVEKLEIIPLSFVIAGIFGYFLVYLLRNLIPTRVGGLLVLGLVFAGSAAMFSYFFIPDVGNQILSSTLGLALGVLIHAVISPRSIYDIFPEVHRNPFEDKDVESSGYLRSADRPLRAAPTSPDADETKADPVTTKRSV